MRRFQFLFISLVFVIFSVIFLPSCNKFKGNQEIPAYLHVDTFLLTTNYPFEGAASHKITDVSVYIDDDFQGYYELPATIPILERGKHELTLMAGIKLNGNSSTRTINPFYVPYVIEDYVFEEKVIDTVTPSTRYYTKEESDIYFEIEDFERQIGLETAPYSDTTIIRTDRDAPEIWTDKDGNSHYSGYIWIGDTLNSFCIMTKPLEGLPDQGNSIFLELDYKCTDIFKVGLFAKISKEEAIDLIYVNPSESWNKIYVNLGPNITNTAIDNPEYFRVFISGVVDESSEAEYYFDNIKVVYRE